MLVCAVPEAAVVNPGSSRISHEPLSISFIVSDMDGRSVVTLISVPARTVLAVTVYSLPLRLRTTGGCGGAAAPRPGPPGPATRPGPPAPGPPGPGAAPGAGPPAR